jgi:Protein of unknown function (DUF3108)
VGPAFQAAAGFLAGFYVRRAARLTLDAYYEVAGIMKIFLVVLLALPLPAESLRYTINWPSGLSLGEVTLRSDFTRDAAAEKGAGHWGFEMNIDASFPGSPVRDRDQSMATSELCSTQLDKSALHGARKTEERVTFDLGNHTAIRETLHGGGRVQMQVQPCARDPLAFLEFVRKELAQGRLAPQQSVVFGAIYQLRLTFKGAESIQVGEEKVDVDHLLAALKGPASDHTFEVFFARDAARTPVLAKIPSPLGTFSVELIR